MRVLVYPHELILGGCPLNAIDLAAAVVAMGHEAAVYGVPGPLVPYIEAKGLRYLPAHPMKYRPAPPRIRELTRLVRTERFDLVHGYEWPPCLDAYFGPRLVAGVPVVCTVYSMALVPLVPPSVPLVMGTRHLAAHAREARGGRVALVEPPVDTRHDHPGLDGTGYRRRLGVADEDLLLVTVSRISVDLKLDALLRAVGAAGELARRHPVTLVVVGTGDAVPQVEAQAGEVNRRHGRPVVRMVGPLLDPRPAYAAADIVLGMGGSALRAMACGKPVVVQGEQGFSAVVEPASEDHFATHGFYGLGDGGDDPGPLAAQIERLAGDAGLRRRLGWYGRQVVTERYSLSGAAAALVELYQETLAHPEPRSLRLVGEAARFAGRAAANEVRLHLPDRRGAPPPPARPARVAAGRPG